MELVQFSDIVNHKQYWMNKIANGENHFVLFQYGPYLVMHYDLDNPVLSSIGYHNNAILKMMIDCAKVIKCCESNGTYKETKAKLISILSELPDDSLYADVTKGVIQHVLEDIKTHQYEEKSLESAMLNYSPIVPYMGTIVKPDMEHHDEIVIKREQNLSQLKKIMQDYLKKYIIQILINNENFISVEDMSSSYMLTKDEINTDLSYDVMKLCNAPNNPVSRYFTIVYMRFCIDPDKFDEVYNNLIKLNVNYNKIIKGEEVDVKEAMEAFGHLSLPPLNNLPFPF